MILLTSFAMLGEWQILMIGAGVLLLFGGTKIPQLMRGLGRGMGEFQAGISEGKDLLSKSMKDAREGVTTDEHKTSTPEEEASALPKT